MSATMEATRAVEKRAVSLRLPEARRYFNTIANHLSDPDGAMQSYTLTGADGQRLRVLLDAIDEVLGQVPHR